MRARVSENTWERSGSITQRHTEHPEVLRLLVFALPVLF